MTESEMLAWIASVERAPATVLACRHEALDCARIEIATWGHPVADSLARPGQFVALGLPAGPARFFAVATPPPAHDRVEFVVQRGGDVSDALVELAAGATVSMSAALGDGYPVDALRDHNVVAFTTGTGLAAVRPLVDALLAGGTPATSVHVYHGSATSNELLFAAELQNWASLGVHVHTVFDDQPVRYVQTAWESDSSAPAPGDARYVVCGSEPMQRAVASSLRAAGVPDDHVFYNW